MFFFQHVAGTSSIVVGVFFPSPNQGDQKSKRKTNGWPGKSTKYTEVLEGKNVAPRHEAIYCVLSTKPGHEL